MHALAWILVIWGGRAGGGGSLGDVVAIYSTEQKCVAAGIDKTTADPGRRIAAYQLGVRYRCESVPFNPSLKQKYDRSDYTIVSGQG